MWLWRIIDLFICTILPRNIAHSFKLDHKNFIVSRNHFNIATKAQLDGDLEYHNPGRHFFTENTIYPNIKSVILSIKDSILPKYDKLSDKNPIVLLAISGGVDSMAMLHSFYEIFINADLLSNIQSNKNDIKSRLERMYNNTYVVHFNHKLRSNSEKDWNFVKETCNSLQFPFIGIKADQNYADINANLFDFIETSVISSNKIKTQSQARSWRNEKFADVITKLYSKSDIPYAQLILPDTRISFGTTTSINILSSDRIKALGDILSVDNVKFNENKIGYVFTAHTLDESVETIIFKLFRGVHIKNIRGIGSFEPLDVNNEITLVRPFVFDYKKSLTNYMKLRNLPWREDESNSQTYYRRNIIRNDLIPILSKLISNLSTKNLKEQIQNDTFEYEKGFLPEQIANRMNNLCDQSEMANDMIESECEKFEKHINGNTIHAKENSTFKQISNKLRQESYNNLMDKLSKKQIQFYKYIDCRRVNKIIEHMKSFGFHMPECFSISKLSLIEHDMVKMTVLKRWIEKNTKGVLMDYKALKKVYEFVLCGYNNTLKYFVLNKDYAISHQGMFMRIINKIEKDITPIKQANSDFSDGIKIYSDNIVNFYSHDSLNVRIDEERIKTFGVKLSVPIIDNFIHDFDVRFCKVSDTMPSYQLGGKNIWGILGKMNVPCLLKDSIPVIALRKSNEIVGIYGLKPMPPHYPKSDILIDYDWDAPNPASKSFSNLFKTYRINVIQQ